MRSAPFEAIFVVKNDLAVLSCVEKQEICVLCAQNELYILMNTIIEKEDSK